MKTLEELFTVQDWEAEQAYAHKHVGRLVLTCTKCRCTHFRGVALGIKINTLAQCKGCGKIMSVLNVDDYCLYYGEIDEEMVLYADT